MDHPFFANRKQRRAARLAAFHGLSEATKHASSGWDLRERLNGQGLARPATLPETVRKAVALTRSTLDELGEFPLPPTIEYQSVKSVRAAAGGTERNPLIADGVVMLHARFVTKTGVRDSFDIPVLVKNGQVIQPSVMLHQGSMKVLAPSSVREIVAQGTFTQQAPPRSQFGGPLQHAEIQQWNRIERDNKTHTRLNPGMFSVSSARDLLRAAVHGEGAFQSVRAQLGEQPSRASMAFKASPASRVGDRVVTEVEWDPERAEGMSDGNLANAVRSFVLELGSKKEWRDWGTVADVQIDSIDRDAGLAEVSFKSSEISAPQLAGADLKTAAVGPSQSDTDLDPAERDRSEQLHVGEEVSLTKGQLLRNRGGGTDVISKGTKGKIVGDVFGDGLELKILFDGFQGPICVPSGHVKRASTVTADKVLREIEDLRTAGYSPIDVILTARQRYGDLGEVALRQAKAKGLLDW